MLKKVINRYFVVHLFASVVLSISLFHSFNSVNCYKLIIIIKITYLIAFQEIWLLFGFYRLVIFAIIFMIILLLYVITGEICQQEVTIHILK